MGNLVKETLLNAISSLNKVDDYVAGKLLLSSFVVSLTSTLCNSIEQEIEPLRLEGTKFHKESPWCSLVSLRLRGSKKIHCKKQMNKEGCERYGDKNYRTYKSATQEKPNSSNAVDK